MATTLGDMGLVGSYGAAFARFNIHYFGYIAHLYLLALLYPLYRFYRQSRFTFRRLEITLATLLLLFDALLFQALFAKPPFQGKIGLSVLEALLPLIGRFGVWLLLLTALSLALMILFEKRTDELFKTITQKASQLLARLKARPSKTPPPPPPAPEPEEVLEYLEEYLEESRDSSCDSPKEEIPVVEEFEPEEEDRYARLVRLVKNPAKESESDFAPSPSLKIIKEALPPKVESPALLQESPHEITPLLTQESPAIPANDSHHISLVQETTPIQESLPAPKPAQVEPAIHKLPTSAPEPLPQPTPAPSAPTEESTPIKESLRAPQTPLETSSSDSPVIIKELEENLALLRDLEFGESTKPKDFKLPPLEFLQQPSGQKVEIDEAEIDRKIQDLLGKLRMFKIEGDIARTYSGPIVTTFEFRPAPSVKVSRILTLEDDLAMALKAKTIRIQAPVPGKDVVGIEIPNQTVETIYLREILESELFQKSTSPLTLALGKDIVGKPFITDLKKLPHLLIAGTTGSGKSVGINAMILSLLYKNSPDNLKLIMIDPKMLEFSIYNDIPHLLTPVITQPKKAIAALASTVAEMERRYEAMSQAKTKNIENYNEKARKEGFEPFPYIVVIIDELADLMMTGGKDVEYSIARLAQMARASGIHLIVATQRPSVDIVTGLIKANLPSRISYKVGQKIDSKVILDSFGAESLLGRGDMLFTPPGSSGLVRLHAPWSTEDEIEAIVDHLKSQRSAEYDESFLGEEESGGTRGILGGEDSGDELYEEAKRIILSDKKTSISYIQRRLGVGYNKAATIIEQMEKRGFLSAPNNKGNREILGG